MRNSLVEGMTAEQLLITCATAIEQSDVNTVKQVVSALRKITSVNGEPSERVAAYFLHALVRRAGSMLDPSFLARVDLPSPHDGRGLKMEEVNMISVVTEVQWTERKWSLNELSRFVDLTPYFRFGYTAANGALLEAFEGQTQIHVMDFSTTHGMQWPTFIEALADRAGGPPHTFRLTLSSASLPTGIAPRLQTTYEEVGHRLSKYARLKHVPFEFTILTPPLESLLSAQDFPICDGEALGVNFSIRLHYLADESQGSGSMGSMGSMGSSSQGSSAQPQPLCPRDHLLHLIRTLNPVIVTLYEEDCAATSCDVVKRLENSFAYEWMPFDFIATFCASGNREREEYERSVGRKIENIVAYEGERRMERLESKRQWLQRMGRMRFRAVPASEEVVSALQDVVEHHNTGWGMKEEEEEGTQALLWKGNSLAFASAWVPAR